MTLSAEGLNPPINRCIKAGGEVLPENKSHHRRWTVIASGLLCGLLALVVVFTNRAAFFSPIAIVVVAAIGAAAVLLQLQLRNREQVRLLHPPVWFNLLGIVFAVVALFADRLRLSPHAAQLIALCAIASFAVSSLIILHSFRKDRMASK
jgi:uncharacterized membrane protein HdeD (DUF308 family)